MLGVAFVFVRELQDRHPGICGILQGRNRRLEGSPPWLEIPELSSRRPACDTSSPDPGPLRLISIIDSAVRLDLDSASRCMEEVCKEQQKA